MYTDGIKVDLTEEEVKETIDWGRRNKDSFGNLLRPCLFGKFGLYEENGMIITKTLELAAQSALAAITYRTLTEAQVNQICKSKYFAIRVNTYASKKDFLKACSIVLGQGKKIIRPKRIERVKETDPTAGFFGIPYYRGYVMGLFSYSDIDPKAKTTIVLIKVIGESRFEVDFSKYK